MNGWRTVMFCSVLHELVELLIKFHWYLLQYCNTFMVMQIKLLLLFSCFRNAVALKAFFLGLFAPSLEFWLHKQLSALL